jgi:hypothetical protein
VESELAGAGAAADLVGPFDDEYASPASRQLGRGGEPVGPGTDHDCVVFAHLVLIVPDPRYEMVTLPTSDHLLVRNDHGTTEGFNGVIGERTEVTEPSNTENWAEPVDAFHVGEVAEGARKGNVEGRRPTGPLQGFGRLWQKTYEVRIPGPTPEEVIATWKENFGEFWYPTNKFYAPAGGIAPGEVAVIGGGRGPTKITTGVRVIYADETSWSYMTPEGHPWAAIITFSAHEGEDGDTVARIHLLVRANDPLYEMSFKIYTSRLEDQIWTHTLTRVAGHFGVTEPEIAVSVVLVDKRRQWNQMSNLWKNSALRTLLRRDR